MMKLDKEERDLLAAFDRGELKSVPNGAREIARYRDYAKSHFQKNKRVNIRISEGDLVHIQKKAVKEGLPYQMLMSSVLHKFIAGRFVEKTA
jgi:predicted DNA binding CopG/RHH family protein